MNILVASSYPPTRCGIGAYAKQQVASLRANGDAVEILTWDDGEGDVNTSLRGGVRLLKLIVHARRHDRTHLHWSPAFFLSSSSAASRIATSLAWLVVAAIAGRRIQVIVHEQDTPMGVEPLRRPRRWFVDRWSWQMLEGLVFHSQLELEAFCASYGLNPQSARLRLVEHGRFFVPADVTGLQQARESLGIAPSDWLVLCIGFVQPSKGFDRVVRAMREVSNPAIRLRIVGSVRVATEEARKYANELHELCEPDPRCEFIEDFVTDGDFDQWIFAADCVVVPYRTIWSSGVVARAALLGTSLWCARVGALEEQAPKGTRFFDSDEQLRALLDQLV